MDVVSVYLRDSQRDESIIEQQEVALLDVLEADEALQKPPPLTLRISTIFKPKLEKAQQECNTYKTTLNSPSAESCMNQQMKMLKYPAPQGGGIVLVKYPLIFSAK